jgi:DnaJ-like protein
MNRATAPSLDFLLDAYALLEADHTASAAEVRRAYRAMARRHHPDRVPAGSSEHAQATTQMAAVNAAYEYIREAPLRHHPISRSSDVDFVYTQAQVDEAMRVARLHRRMRDVAAATGFAIMFVVAAIAILPALRGAGIGSAAGMVLVLAVVTSAFLVRRSVEALAALDGVLALVRLLTIR